MFFDIIENNIQLLYWLTFMLYGTSSTLVFLHYMRNFCTVSYLDMRLTMAIYDFLL